MKQISKSLNPLDHMGLKGTIPHTEKSAPSAKHTKYKSTPRGEMRQLRESSEFSDGFTGRQPATDFTENSQEGFHYTS